MIFLYVGAETETLYQERGLICFHPQENPPALLQFRDHWGVENLREENFQKYANNGWEADRRPGLQRLGHLVVIVQEGLEQKVVQGDLMQALVTTAILALKVQRRRSYE